MQDHSCAKRSRCLASRMTDSHTSSRAAHPQTIPIVGVALAANPAAGAVLSKRAPGPYRTRAPRHLSPQTELINELSIAVKILPLQIVEQTTSLAHDSHQSTTRMMILLVVLEVLGELVQALGQKTHLNLRRTGVRGMPLMGPDHALLNFRGTQMFFLSFRRFRSRA